MAFASFDSKRGMAPVAEINMVPLIDVMLVLLVIFIVTAPLLTHAVKLDLPKVSAQPEVHLRADQAVAYRAVAETLADATRAGLSRIGFVSEPESAATR